MTRKEAREYIIKHCNPHRDTGTKWDDAMECAIKALGEPERKKGKWILDEDPHDGDCRCSACLIAIDQMHKRNHSLLNALTGGKWWTFYKYCPNCGADMTRGEQDET